MEIEKTDYQRVFWGMAIVAAFGCLLLSCNILGSKESDDCGPGIIVPGVCVDGIKLGDSRERVEELLGEPSGMGLRDGITRGWRTYWYKPPGAEGGGLTISFYIEKDGSWGPVDAFNAHKPYDGKTLDGVGIGSTLGEVRNVYGEPDDIPSDVTVDGTHRLQYTYCFDSIKLTIGMHDQIVIGFFMGHFIPIEQDQTFQCK